MVHLRTSDLTSKNKEIHHDEFYWSEEAVNACKKRQIECYDINSNLLDSSYLDN